MELFFKTNYKSTRKPCSTFSDTLNTVLAFLQAIFQIHISHSLADNGSSSLFIVSYTV